jgi:predicted kinase
MGRLIVMCGLPGSGKSWVAEQILDSYLAFESDGRVVIHSSDAIREELFGDAGSQEDNARVFELMHKRVREDLKKNYTVIYDATNITRKARRGAINCATDNDEVECYIVWADPEVCIERDKARSRTVGRTVIDKMLRRWQSPHWNEGFDSVHITCSDPNFDQVFYVAFAASTMHMPHNNPHHTTDVWEHCQVARNYLLTHPLSDAPRGHIEKDLVTAAMWHDIGKPWTKSWHVNKETGIIDYSHAHYYDHHCVGGYLTYGLFLNTNLISEEETRRIYWISWLVCNHMEPFFDSHYYRDLPEYEKRCIDCLHEADVNAH